MRRELNAPCGKLNIEISPPQIPCKARFDSTSSCRAWDSLSLRKFGCDTEWDPIVSRSCDLSFSSVSAETTVSLDEALPCPFIQEGAAPKQQVGMNIVAGIPLASSSGRA